MATEQWTYFHIPDSTHYDPWQTGQDQAYGGAVEGWVSLPDGAEVTLHGYNGRTFRVAGSHFHVGQEDEAGGMHVYLTE